MSVETLLRTSRLFYQETYLKGPVQLFMTLFRNEDMDDSANVLLDEFIDEPYAVAYRDKNNQAHIRNYLPGSGTLYEPPIASEKTPIDEKLRDEAVEGVEATAGFSTAQMRKVDKVIGIHGTAHNMTKNKQAIDVLREGVFYAPGIDGNEIGKNEDFSRAAGNDITADFSTITIDEALTAANEVMNTNNAPRTGRAVILGASWQAELESDTNVLTKMQANTSNVLIRQNLNPPDWMGTEGLEWLGEYRPSGSSNALQLFSYNPGVQYKSAEGATAEAWIPDDEMVMFSFASPTWRVFRGLNVVESFTQIGRDSGEIVFDSYVEGDPPAEFLRSQTRHVFLYGNINHTVRSTGSNFS